MKSQFLAWTLMGICLVVAVAVYANGIRKDHEIDRLKFDNTVLTAQNRILGEEIRSLEYKVPTRTYEDGFNAAIIRSGQGGYVDGYMAAMQKFKNSSYVDGYHNALNQFGPIWSSNPDASPTTSLDSPTTSLSPKTTLEK